MYMYIKGFLYFEVVDLHETKGVVLAFFLQQGALFTNLTRLSYLFYKQLYPHPRKKTLGAGWGWGGGVGKSLLPITSI